MSLSSTLNVAVSGLHAAQAGIDVTGQNIANANTEGYSRKRLSQVAGIRLDEVFGEQGMGVEVNEIKRVRDEFLDQQIREQLGDKGYHTQLDEGLTRLESLLSEPSENGLNESLNKFFDAWQDLANNPGDLSAREAVKSTARDVTDLFHSLSQEMTSYRDDLNGMLVKQVNEANDLMRRISEYNAEIAAIESQEGANANDSRDQRDVLVRKLGELLDITSQEDAQGHLTLSSGGTLLVGPVSYMPLETYAKSFTRADGVQISTLGVRLQEGKKILEPRSGSIKGLNDLKERIIPGYEMKLDALAAGLVGEINAIHQTGYSLNRHTGLDFFNPAGTRAGTIALSDAVFNDSKNIAAAAGGTSAPASVIPAGGIPAQASPTFDLKTIDPRYRFVAQGSVQITHTATGDLLEEGPGKDYVVDYTLGTVTFLNYARFNAADAVTIDFRYEQNGFPGNGDGANALAMAQLRQRSLMAPDPNGNPTQTFGDFYSAVIGELGTAKNQNANSLTTKEALIQQMDETQSSVAGVSLDEEMTNMIKYEHAYQASARVISTLEQMMDVLMNI